MPRNSDTKDEVTISISGVPMELLRELNEIADSEDRDRSSQIVRFLREAVSDRRERAERKRPKAA